MKNWFITGVSRGFGKILAEELLLQGHQVIGTTRSGVAPIKHERLRTLKLNVDDEKEVIKVVDEAARCLSHIDYVVNNAGFGVIGAIEEVRLKEVNQAFATNFYGTFHVIQAVLPYLRKQGFGHILNFSSIAGFTGSPGLGIYNAAKFAVEGLSEALAAEIEEFGLRVTIIEPGAFRTEFLSDKSLICAENVIPAYENSSGRFRSFIKTRNGSQPGNPELAVKAIIDVVTSENCPLRLPLGRDCLERMQRKINQVQSDISQWESIARATSY